jgi:hypothetical protein
VSGVVGFDTIRLGVKVKKHTIQLATSLGGAQFEKWDCDGLLGLGGLELNSVQPDPAKTFLDALTEHDLLPEPLFTLNLFPHSFATFGFIDEFTLGEREIHWVDVPRRGIWKIPTGVARVGEKTLSRPGQMASLSTATSLILTSPSLTREIYARIEGSQYHSQMLLWVYPTTSTVPPVGFSVGHDDTCMVMLNEQSMRGQQFDDGWVIGAIQENSAYLTGKMMSDIFGVPFFKQVYAIFKLEGPKFGVSVNLT